TLNRSIALKLLPADFSANKERLNRFKREAHAASSLNHPNILTIYEIGAERGLNFIATEFIDGESLRQYIKRPHIELGEVLDIGMEVASALTAAHAAGIVHRDIKPENIMMRRDRIVKVLDFGLAKLVGQETPVPDSEAPTKAFTKTEAGIVLGTVSYMSPEQARGVQVDARTDIWSLGVVLYEMVAGRLPFTGETISDTIAAILKTEPPNLNRYVPNMPVELERIVMKALRKDRDERYQVVRYLALDLKSLKQRLEFEAELERVSNRGQPAIGALERTGTPEKRNREAPGDGGATTVAMHGAAAPQTSAANDLHTTPSAEQIGNKINRRKSVPLVVLAILISATAIAAIAYFVYPNYHHRSDQTKIDSTLGIRSIAVLPFANVNNNPDTEFLSDGISESLINSLSQLPQLKIIARSSSFKYKGKDAEPEMVANALGVEAILIGRVTQRGENLLINVALVDARDRTNVWGEQYNRKAVDLLQVQAEISREIAERLRLRLSAGERQQLSKRETVNPHAYELLLRGRFHWSKGGTENRNKAIEYYKQAIAVDANYALAYAELSASYSNLVGNSVLDPKEFTPRAEVAVLKALALDETLADAHLALANFKVNAWDWAAAEQEYRRALQLNPNLAEAHRWYANYLGVMRRHDEAIAKIKRAREIDPISLPANADVGFTLFLARQYDQAIESLKKTIELDHIYPITHAYLGYTYAAKKMYAEAIAAYQEALKYDRDSLSNQIYLGAAYAAAGERVRAETILKRLQTSSEYVSPVELAALYVALGEREQAFASLEKAYAAHDLQLQYLGVDPALDHLRSDSRFTDLMRRVGLIP
ncbi:MAG: protein kinase, partial [Acidobacteriota bacterium]|nr:protein kinase [Acidobacteriota bacterium]